MATSLIYDRSALAGFFSTPEVRRDKYLRERLLPGFAVDPSQSNGRVYTRGRLADIDGSIEYGHCADPRMMPPAVSTSVTYDASPYGLTDRVSLGLQEMSVVLADGGLVQLAIADLETAILKAKDVELGNLILNTQWSFDQAPDITWDETATAVPLDDIEEMLDSVDDANVLVVGKRALNLLRRTTQFRNAMPQNVFGDPRGSDLESLLSDRFGVEVIVPRAKAADGSFLFGDHVFAAHIEPGYANPRGGVFGSSALLRPEVIPLSAEVWHNPLPGAVTVGADEIKVGGWEDMIAVSVELGALLHDVDGE